jgi:phosphoserine aminotransferase
MDNKEQAEAMYEAIIRKSMQWYQAEAEKQTKSQHTVWVPIPQSAMPSKR